VLTFTEIGAIPSANNRWHLIWTKGMTMGTHREILKRHRLPIALVAGNLAFASLFMTLALSAFHQPTPHDLKVGVVGSAPVTRTLQRKLDTAAPGGFELRAYPSEAQARDGIDDRRLDGALITAPRDPRLLIANAGGSGAARALTSAFTAATAQAGQHLEVVDVVPPVNGDSQGLSSFFVILCVLFPSLATGVAAAHLLRHLRPVPRVVVPVVAAVAIGLAAAGIADGVSGLGNYLPIAGIVALFSLAISLPTAALGEIKPPLVVLAVLLFLILGLPVSGGPGGLAPFGPSLLRFFDSALPLGAAADAVRNTVYFGAHDIGAYLLVLAAWAVAGVVALGVATRLNLSRRPENLAAIVPAR
jgi:hypothetical protein